MIGCNSLNTEQWMDLFSKITICPTHMSKKSYLRRPWLNRPIWNLSLRDTANDSSRNDGVLFTSEQYHLFSIHGGYLQLNNPVKDLPQAKSHPVKRKSLIVDERMMKKAKTVDNISKITNAEHEQYLRLIGGRKYAILNGLHWTNVLSEADQQLYMSLRPLVYEEQERYYQHWVQQQSNQIGLVSQVLQDIERGQIQAQIQRNIKTYKDVHHIPDQYRLALRMECNFDWKEKNSYPNHIKTLDPPIQASPVLPSSIQMIPKKMKMNIPITSQHSQRPLSSLLSQDPWVLNLMEKHQLDGAISSTTLSLFFGTPTDRNTHSSRRSNVNPDFVSVDPEEQWNVPMIIRTCPRSRKKQIYFEKPLVRVSMPLREQHHRVYSSSVRQHLHTPGSSSVLPKNYSFDIWQFGTMKILVRCGYSNPFVDSEGVSTHLHVKVDYLDTEEERTTTGELSDHKNKAEQFEEQVTVKELSHWWLHTWLRGNSKVYVARVHPLVQESQKSTCCCWIQVEENSLSDLLTSRQTARIFDPQHQFHLFTCQILPTVSELPKGQYLLSYEARQDCILAFHSTCSSTVTEADVHRTTHDQPPNDRLNFSLYRVLEQCPEARVALRPGLPKWTTTASSEPSHAHQIPYTFPPPKYCLDFLTNEKCSHPRPQVCPYWHLRPSRLDALNFDLFTSSCNKVMKTLMSKSTLFCKSFVYHGKCDTKQCTRVHQTLDQMLRYLIDQSMLDQRQFSAASKALGESQQKQKSRRVSSSHQNKNTLRKAGLKSKSYIDAHTS